MSMPPVDVPASNFWAAAGAVILGVFSWLLKLQIGQSNRLTRAEHEKICEQRDVIVSAQLQDIKTILAQQNRVTAEQSNDSRDHRDRVANALHALALKVAVIQTQLRHPESEG